MDKIDNSKDEKKSMGTLKRLKGIASFMVVKDRKDQKQQSCYKSDEHARKLKQQTESFFALEFDGLHCFETLVTN